MNTEILWNDKPDSNFLKDLKSFAMSLDYYQIVWDLTKTDDKKFLKIDSGNYEILSEAKENIFECPVCKRTVFEIMEGELDGKPALGLVCLTCETYGAVFPKGM